jgi:serine/threonine protein kinase
MTLWYRAPEILLGTDVYSPCVDMWSVGTVFAEMVLGRPLWSDDCQIGQLMAIFRTLGTPKDHIWPETTCLPDFNVAWPDWPPKKLETVFPTLDSVGRDLMKVGRWVLFPRIL